MVDLTNYEERFNLINGVLESYTYYKNKNSIHKDFYAKFLSSLIKKYGNQKPISATLNDIFKEIRLQIFKNFIKP